MTGNTATRLISACCLLALISSCFYVSRIPDTFGLAGADERLAPGALPRPDHIVIVVEENSTYGEIVGNPDAPFVNALAAAGVSFNRAYGETHPSQPNYLALFSGSTQGVTSDGCNHAFNGANLASTLGQAGFSFETYSQSLPRMGFTGCRAGDYARKHNPAVNWQGANVLASQNRAFSDFPEEFDRLPTVSLVIPDQIHDMHSGSIAAGDRWLRDKLGRYARWAGDHNSLLIVTWDEDDYRHHNRIPTIIAGAMIKPGESAQPINHYNVLRTIEAMYQLPLLGESAKAAPITDIWRQHE